MNKFLVLVLALLLTATVAFRIRQGDTTDTTTGDMSGDTTDTTTGGTTDTTTGDLTGDETVDYTCTAPATMPEGETVDYTCTAPATMPEDMDVDTIDTTVVTTDGVDTAWVDPCEAFLPTLEEVDNYTADYTAYESCWTTENDANQGTTTDDTAVVTRMQHKRRIQQQRRLQNMIRRK
jgi:hypothetical protein